jgi:protein SCO1/2
MRKLICGVLILTSFAACKHGTNKTLPVYGDRHAETIIVKGQQVTDTVYKTIRDFTFVNQYGDSTGTKNLKGDIYVAEFFFTTCPSICPGMQRNMLHVYDAFKDSANFKIVAFTIDPKHDTVPVLKKYADKLGISGNTWWFLNGEKDKVYDLAAKDYLVAVNADSTVAGGYVHQGYFVLVDKQERVRGAYDGTDMKQVDQLIADIKLLKTEPTDKL